MNKLLKNFCFTATAVAIVANSFAFTACGHEHTAGESVRENIVAASCTQSGSYDEVVYCADCNEEISRTQKTIAQTAHTPSIEVIKENEAPATCAKEGSYDEVIKCVDCGGEASRKHKTIEKLPHSYAETYSKDATGHWYECTECGDKNGFTAHIPGEEATETTSQICTVCEYVLAAPINHTHSLTLVAEKEAECFNAGNIAYYTCKCGEWFADEQAADKIDNHESVILKPTGHRFADTWSSDADHHWHAATCTHTEELKDKAEHDMDNGTVSGNKKIYTCAICDYREVKKIFTVTYNYNYSGSPAAVTSTVEEGGFISTPKNFLREGYGLVDWCTDTACTVVYDIKTAVNQDLQLYAKWEEPEVSVIEAEYMNLRGLKGVGYSSETTGVGMIQSDYNSAANASNGYFVGYLYRYNLTLTFKFTSSKETFDAKIALRLSGEMVSRISLTSDEFVVKVNGEQQNFEKIVISGIDTDMTKNEKREFQDFTVGTGVHLLEGENTITLTVNNSKGMGGNMRSTAPLVDCLKVYSVTNISYDPILTNLDRFN